ncbi:Similar to conserved hypothetical protein [Arthroderma otae CBS 113480]; acc. no. XP_002847693 [Pyronema omphalodes CBS 100304]|uniref:Uncharacterized protein n=1 Tax=Pyronema omphalodes (strain CBS 100304) TaxID=1076935 RepID=U4L6G7_PYROM|nr:Similar to conserved hypothetical protein [Arthroderma otae CBS 113480]; acc. no. XP_002847693 [Pyronema omphalodes CBS 100304]
MSFLDRSPVSIAITDFLNVTTKITKILTSYLLTNHFPTEAPGFLTEFEAFSHVLRGLNLFIDSEDISAHRFNESSTLFIAVEVYQARLQGVCTQLDSIRDWVAANKPAESSQEAHGELQWPFEKDEGQGILEDLRGVMVVFKFAMGVKNWFVVARS